MPHATETAAPPEEPPQVVRIQRGAEHLVERLAARGEFRSVGLAEGDRARGLEALHQQVVLAGNVVRVDRRAERRADSLRDDGFLVGDRQTRERARIVGARARALRVQLFRLLQRRLREEGDDGVHLGVHALDLRDVRAHHLDCRNFPRAHEAREFLGRLKDHGPSYPERRG